MMWPITLLPVGKAAVMVVCTGVIDAMPWMVSTSTEAAPAPPKAGCLAAVAAPVGSAEPDTATDTVPGIETVTGVMPATPWTDRTSVEAAPGVAKVGCLAEVAAPVGKAALETVTGTVPTMIAWMEPELSTVMHRSVTDLSQTVSPCRCAVPLGVYERRTGAPVVRPAASMMMSAEAGYAQVSKTAIARIAAPRMPSVIQMACRSSCRRAGVRTMGGVIY